MKSICQGWRASVLGAVVLLAACDGGGGGGGVAPAAPTAVVAASATTQSAVAGTAVAEAPAVRVTDQRGQAMAGVAVTFAVSSGGGALATTAATTNASGVATSTGWTLGAVAGQNSVTATVGSLAPVQFIATAQPRTPTAITATSAVTQSAPVGTAVAEAPTVRVNDQSGQPLPGITVTFAVTGGGGTVGSTTATTSAAGLASAGSWTLGPAAGANTVTATVAGLAPVTFTATGQTACALATLYTPLSTVSAAFTTADCHLASGEYVDFYAVTLASAQAITFRMTSAAVDTWLELYDASQNIVALNDDDATSTNSQINLFAPSGSYLMGATTFDPNELGAYQLSSAAFAGNVNCDEYWIVPGVIVPGSVLSSDCNFGGYFADEYLVVLRPGQTLTVRLESAAFDALLELYDTAGTLVASNDDGAGGTNSLLTYTATALNVFFIDATTFDAGATGAYSLTVTRS
jgi:LysM repeat protein